MNPSLASSLPEKSQEGFMEPIDWLETHSWSVQFLGDWLGSKHRSERGEGEVIELF